MTNKKIVFIILHYIVEEVTIESIEHIKKNMDIDEYQIIVVDNASPNQSYSILENRYGKDERVVLIHNENNLGFTRGNNVGISYALKNYDYEYIVVFNNDVFLLETAFYCKISRYFEKYRFAVAGPRIIDRYGRDSNPMADRLPTMEEVEENIFRAKKMVRLGRSRLFKPYLFYLKTRKKMERINKIMWNKEKIKMVTNEVKENTVLHGSCWVFTHEYFDVYNGLTEKKGTFIEEETLLYKVLQAGLKNIYMPDVLVLHLEDVATDAAYAKDGKKEKYAYEQFVISWEEYKKMILEDNLLVEIDRNGDCKKS